MAQGAGKSANGSWQKLSASLWFADLAPPPADFARDLCEGLARTPKKLAAKYFYDERGAKLFEEICCTPEYYITRTECALLQTIAPELEQLAGPEASVVEFGSGAMAKIKILLAALAAPQAYAAIDIARRQLLDQARALSAHFPALAIYALCADFLAPVPLPDTLAADKKRLGFLPGSTIGNFSPAEGAALLAAIKASLTSQGRAPASLLIGVDLKKNPQRLIAAYNDRAGRTAAFNLNLLTRIKRELKAELDVDGFAHEARYNGEAGRIEMHLRARRDQQIRLPGNAFGGAFAIAEGETIHTENSYKYDMDEFSALAQAGGFTPRRCWRDEDKLFSIHWLDA